MRWWNELAAGWDEGVLGLGFTALILLLAATVVAVVWYTWPAMSPQNWRQRVRRRREAESGEPVPPDEPAEAEEPELSDERLPELPAGVLTDQADRYAAEGRYAEAVRERLRAMVRELVDRQVVENRPGWTVTELARAAGAARAEVAPLVTRASDTFSIIWYGQRPATAAHDATLRELAESLHQVLAGERR